MNILKIVLRVVKNGMFAGHGIGKWRLTFQYRYVRKRKKKKFPSSEEGDSWFYVVCIPVLASLHHSGAVRNDFMVHFGSLDFIY